MIPSLEPAIIHDIYNYLFLLSKSENFWDVVSTVFGNNYDVKKATNLRLQWEARDFRNFPEIEIVSSHVLGGANGGYAIATKKIYLSDYFLANANSNSVIGVVLEEYGHFVDAHVNSVDTQGDEGQLFSALVRGIQLNEEQLQLIKAEDDSAIVSIDGETFEIEQSNYNLGIVQGNRSWNDSVSYSDYGDNWTFQISATGGSSNYISVYSSNTTSVDLVLALYNQYGTLIGSANSYNFTYNYESLSLSGLSAGTYTAQVYDSYYGQYVYPYSASYTLTINAPQPRPDLTLYNPSGWSSGMVISTTPGTNTDASTITTSNYLYIDAAYGNQGTGATGTGFSSRLLLNGQVIGTKNSNALNSNALDYFTDFVVNPLAAGNYVLTLEIDYLNQISETIETNNIWTKNFTVIAPPLPDLNLYKPTGWSNGIVISTTPGTNTDATTITTSNSLYIDWAAINQGTASTGQSFSTRLLLDGVVLQSWTTTALNANTFTSLNDFVISPLAAGNHTLRLEIDNLSSVTESNEANNVWERQFTVTAPSIPQDAYEGNNSFATATNLGALSGNTIRSNLTIHSSTDTDFFKFTTTGLSGEDNYVAAYFDWTQGVIDLNLFDGAGNFLYYTLGSYGYNYIPLGGLQAGTYYIQAGSYQQQTSPSYLLEFNTPVTLSGDRFESNNTFLTAKDLGTVTGFKQENNLSIHTNTDQDLFKFQISGQTTDQHYIGIDFNNSYGDLGLGLYNSQQQLIDYSDGYSDFEGISLAGLTNGVYYIQVYGYAGSLNDYNLTINAPGTTSSIIADPFEANNTLQTATYLKDKEWLSQIGFKYWENLSIGTSDQDWFKFDLQKQGTSGDYVGISFDTYQGDLDLELYNSSGTLLKSAKGFRDIESISLESLAVGTYYAKVVGFSGKTNPNYTLFINTPGSDRFEENDTKDRATILNRSTAIQTWDSLSIDDQDWFKINLPSGVTSNDYISISFDHSQGDIDLELYNSTGTTKLLDSTGVGDTEEISLTGLSSGDYYIKVFGYNNATNPNYSLTVNAPISNNGDWLEANNTAATAKDLNTQFSQQLQAGETFIQLGADAEKPLSIHNNTDKDWFKFTITSEGKLGDYASISFNHTAGDLDLYLYNSATATTPIRKSEGIANAHTIDLKGLAAGTYYLQVAGFGGATNSSYSLAIQAPFVQKTGDWSESNNTSASARDLGTIIDSYSKGNLSIHNSSDIDWFKFTLGATGGLEDNIGITFNHGQGDLDIELYQADGVTLINDSVGVTGSEEISLNTLAAGTYLLKVFGYNGAINPDYSLFIEAPENVNGDWAEQGNVNNDVANARDLRNVEGFQTWQTLSIHNTSDVDWFNFTTIGTGDANDFVRIAFDQSLGDLELYLYSDNAEGTTILKKSETINNIEEVSLSGLAAGTYLIQVKGYNGAINPSYQLAINAPDSSTIPSDWADKNGTNNTRDTAEDLLKLDGANVFSGLSIHQGGDEDWFKFETLQAGIAGNAVSINFDQEKGDLKLELYNSAGTLLTTSNENSNRELISLEGRSAGVYFVRVLGNTTSVTNPEVTNPDYSLIIDAPETLEKDWIDKGTKPNSSLANAYDLRSINGTTNPNYNLIFNAPPALETTGDWAEKDTITNDTSTLAYDLKTIEGGTSLSGLTIHTTTDKDCDKDWFQFKTTSTGKEGHRVRIDFAHNLGDLDLILYNQDGTTVRGRSETTEDFEEISLNGLAAGTYKIQVLGYKGATNPNYSLSVFAPNGTTTPIEPDNLEPNNSFTTATNLDQVNKLSGISGLTIHSGDNDYFKFTTTKTGTASNFLSIGFEHAQGDLQLELYREGSTTTPLKFSRGTTNNETITLDGLVAGTYYAKVFGNGTTVANGYELYIDAPTEAVTTKDEWTIFVYMTGSDLAQSAFNDINEMEYAASLLPSNVNIVVLWDQSSLSTTYATGTNSAWGDTGWAVIRPDTDEDKVATTFTLLGEKNTGDANTLVEFLNIAKTAAPANKYGLIMWDHGGGEIGGFNVDNEGVRNSTTADRLYTNELVNALNTVKTGGVKYSHSLC